MADHRSNSIGRIRHRSPKFPWLPDSERPCPPGGRREGDFDSRTSICSTVVARPLLGPCDEAANEGSAAGGGEDRKRRRQRRLLAREDGGGGDDGVDHLGRVDVVRRRLRDDELDRLVVDARDRAGAERAPESVGMSRGPRALGLACVDVDGDRRDDIVLCDTDRNRVLMRLSGGSSRAFADETILPEDLKESLTQSMQKVQVDDDDDADEIGSLSLSAEALRLTASAPARTSSMGGDFDA